MFSPFASFYLCVCYRRSHSTLTLALLLCSGDVTFRRNTRSTWWNIAATLRSLSLIIRTILSRFMQETTWTAPSTQWDTVTESLSESIMYLLSYFLVMSLLFCISEVTGSVVCVCVCVCVCAGGRSGPPRARGGGAVRGLAERGAAGSAEHSAGSVRTHISACANVYLEHGCQFVLRCLKLIAQASFYFFFFFFSRVGLEETYSW